MHLHILGICGTFMAGIAALARDSGHRVTGSDAAAYPPMSDQLAEQGIEVMQGYHPRHLAPRPDCVVIGNALSRGNPAVEYILNEGLPYTSGPQWLRHHVLNGRWTLAVAGTHGKTTTASMLAWILDYADLEPGFLIGGVPQNFDSSARLGNSKFFVIEADEYDTAFFDKRSKFLHYPARTAIIGNLEHDHIDIFPDIEAIKRQFQHFLRIVPGAACVIIPDDEPHIDEVIAAGCWSKIERFGGSGDWRAQPLSVDASRFNVRGKDATESHLVDWSLIGEHNVRNALAAIAAAHHVGVPASVACQALAQFKNTKRRLEVVARPRNITVYDDFAHHPTAIQTTLAGLRAAIGDQRILALLEPRSNSMKSGMHKDTLGPSLQNADEIWLFAPTTLSWDVGAVSNTCVKPVHVTDCIENLIDEVSRHAKPGDHVVIMSNGAFAGVHQKLVSKLEEVM